MSKSLSQIVGIAGTIFCATTLPAIPGVAETIEPKIVSPTVVEPVSSKDLANNNSRVNSNIPSILPCLRSKSGKFYIQYRYNRVEVPNNPSDYGEAMAKYGYCNVTAD